MWWGCPFHSLRQHFVLRQFLTWWFVFKQSTQSPCSHAIFHLSCRCFDLKAGQKARGCLRLQMTHLFPFDGAFSCSLFNDWVWACLGSDKLLLLLGVSGDVSVVMVRGFNLRLGFALGYLCFLFHSSHMKSSRGLNSVFNDRQALRDFYYQVKACMTWCVKMVSPLFSKPKWAIVVPNKLIDSQHYKRHRRKIMIEFHSPSHFTLTTTQ